MYRDPRMVNDDCEDNYHTCTEEKVKHRKVT